MDLRQRPSRTDTLTRIGLVLLILAVGSRWFLHPGASVPAGIVDGGTGLLYGLSIGCLLIGIRRNNLRRASCRHT